MKPKLNVFMTPRQVLYGIYATHDQVTIKTNWPLVFYNFHYTYIYTSTDYGVNISKSDALVLEKKIFKTSFLCSMFRDYKRISLFERVMPIYFFFNFAFSSYRIFLYQVWLSPVQCL